MRPRSRIVSGIAATALAALALTLAAPRGARALDLPPAKSVSLSQQFIIYCDDSAARSRVSDFAEDTKRRLLALLGAQDQWKFPIVIHLARTSTAMPAQRASAVQIYQNEEGFKVELDVALGADPREARFSEQLVRALLLEMEYRGQPAAIRGGAAYAMPPEWLVTGAVALFESRETGPNANLFRSLLSTDHVPKLTDFLAENTDGLDTTSRSVHALCAMSLVQLLAELPEGRRSLASLVRTWPAAQGNSFGELIRRFPVLGVDTQSVEKWWTLGLARLAAADRYEGLSPRETESRLTALLSFEVALNKAGEKRTFSIEQFEEFRRIAAARPALAAMSERLLALSTESSALLRPVIFEYQSAAADLAHGKTRGMKARLDEMAKYRAALLGRMDDIADYLNWFEGTQLTRRSGAFDGYLGAANAPDTTPKRDDPLTRYMDAVEQQTK